MSAARIPVTMRERAFALLSDKSLRTTKKRRLVVETFFDANEHVSIESLHDLVRAIDPTIGLSTVYRTMRLLVENGIAVERHFADDVARYEPSDDVVRHHDHLICIRCGSILEFEEPRIDAIEREIAARYGYEVHRHEHELYGTCSRCNASGAA